MKITTEIMIAKNPCSEYSEVEVAENRGEKTLKEILGMEDISPEDRVWEVVQLLSGGENRRFAIWCARRANQDNVQEVTKYLDAVEAFHVFGTITGKEMVASRAEYCSAYNAVAANAEDWTTDCPAYKAADWAAYKVAHWAAYNAGYWAATYNAADWTAQIEYLKTAIK